MYQNLVTTSWQGWNSHPVEATLPDMVKPVRVIERDQQCWVCQSQTRLAAREWPLSATEGSLPEANAATHCRLATCFDCRAKVHRLHDNRKIALFQRSARVLRFRAVDYVVMALTLAAGFWIATTAGWFGSWGNFVALGLVLVSAPFGWLYHRGVSRKERQRPDQWAEGPEKQEFDEMETRLAERLQAIDSDLQKQGLTLLGEESSLTEAIRNHSLLRPELWSPMASKPAADPDASAP